MTASRIILPLLVFAASIGMRAQEISFLASVDRTSIAAGDHIKLTVTLNNSREQFSPPDLGGLSVLQGPFESSSFNYVNGKLSSSVSKTWVITGTTPGSYTIGPAKVKVAGGIIRTDPIEIEVTKGTSRPADPGVAQGQRNDPNLFVTISLSKNSAYVGEQIIATYTLYSRYPNIELSKYELPALNGFWSEDIDLDNEGWEDRPEVVNGLQYRVAILKKQLLFPQRSGKLRIAPAELTCIVNRSFFSRGSAIEITSNAAEVTARELPGNAPPDFSGAVGELQMDVNADRTSVNANEAIQLNIKITGRANLKLLDAPSLAFPSDFEVYDPKVNDKIQMNAYGMSGSREFEYLVIPRNEGIYDLDPITFSYFDTRSGSFKTLQSEPLTIEVAPGSAAGPGGGVRGHTRDVTVLDRDIRYIRTGDLDLRPHGRILLGSPAWVAGMATPALALLLFLVWNRKRQADLADEAGTRRRRADQLARRRLSEAEQALKEQEGEKFHAALSKALNGYLADKFGLGIADMNANTVRASLQHHPDGAALSDRYVHLISMCDMARYAPMGAVPRKELYEQAVDLIGHIERNTRS